MYVLSLLNYRLGPTYSLPFLLFTRPIYPTIHVPRYVITFFLTLSPPLPFFQFLLNLGAKIFR